MTQERLDKFLHAVDSKMIIILVLGCISFTTVTISIPFDLLGYMTHALNIVNGHGYTYIDGQPVLFRGPVFSLLIAISFQIFGVSPTSAFYVVRLFCIVNPILIYLFGKKLFNAKVGFVAALIILSSYSISFWSYRLIDASWPFFVILYCYLLYEGFEREKVYLFVLAGSSLGIAYLTKEVALLFFPLSVLMFLWIKQYQNKRNMLGVGVGLIATFIVLLPWVLYLQHHHALHFLWGTGGTVILDDISSALHTSDRGRTVGFFLNLFAAVKGYGAAFIYFYSGQRNTVSANFIIAPLYLVAWLYVFVKSFLGDKGSKILILNVLLFLPIIYFIGKNHWRFGQVLFIMLISSVALAYCLSELVDWFCRVSKVSVPVARTFFFFVVISFVTVQIFSHSNKDLGYANFFKKTKLYHLFRGESTQQIVTGPFFNPYLDKTVEKLTQNIETNESLLVDSLWLARRIFFQFEGKRRIFAFPMLWCRNNKVIRGQLPENTGERALFLTANNLPLEPQYRFYILFESQLTALLHSKQLQYVIVSPRFRELEEFFSRSDNYEEVLRLGPKNNDDKIYYLYRAKEDATAENDIPLLYADQLVLTLNKLRDNDPQRYQSVRDTSLYKIASLPEEDVAAILDSILEIPGYHIELGDQYLEEGNIKEAITEFKEAVRLDPDNLRFHYRLGRLYIESKQFVEALGQLKEAKRLDPVNAGIVSQLGRLYHKDGQLDKAVEEYVRAVKLDPDNSAYHYSLGYVYQEAGFLKKAKKQFETAIGLDPENGVYYRFLGDLYRKNGQLDNAIEQYQAAIELDPENSGFQYLLGRVYQEAGFLKKAKKQFETAIRLDPENGWYHRFLGQLYELNGQSESAVKEYRQAVRLDAENTSFHYLLANLYQRMDYPHKAFEQYKELVRLDPENLQYQKLVGQFEEDRASKVQ